MCMLIPGLSILLHWSIFVFVILTSIIWSLFFLLTCRCCCSVTKSCLTLCDLMNYSTPCFSVHNYLPEFAQTHVHWISDAIQPSHPLSPTSPPALNPSQHQGLFQWVGSLNEVAKELGVSASASILPVNIQDWFHLGLTGLISFILSNKNSKT